MLAILLFAALGIATYTDIKTMTIPGVLFPVTAVITLIYYISHKVPLAEPLAGAALAAIAYFCLALWFNGGGGDILMMSACGLIYGKYTDRLIILASLCFLIEYGIARIGHIEQTELPFAPAVWVAHTVLSIMARTALGLPSLIS